jgi:hypothetical protein
MKYLEVTDLPGHVSSALHQLRNVFLVSGMIETHPVYTITLYFLLCGHSNVGCLHLIAMFLGVKYDFNRAADGIRAGKARKHLALLNLHECLLQSTLRGLIVFKEHLDLAGGVEFTFVVSESCAVPVGSVHGLDESVAVDEGEQGHTHPLVTCTVHIDVEVSRVEVDDLRGWVR